MSFNPICLIMIDSRRAFLLANFEEEKKKKTRSLSSSPEGVQPSDDGKGRKDDIPKWARMTVTRRMSDSALLFVDREMSLRGGGEKSGGKGRERKDRAKRWAAWIAGGKHYHRTAPHTFCCCCCCCAHLKWQ